MSGRGWMGATSAILATCGDTVDAPKVRECVNAYVVRSPHGTCLQFSVPLLLPFRPDVDPRGADGAVWAGLEAVKRAAPADARLHPLGGLDTDRPAAYAGGIEPITLVRSASRAGTGLWKPDEENYLDAAGLHCTVHGAVPYPGPPEDAGVREVAGAIADLADAIRETVQGVPAPEIAAAATLSLDQKLLRQELPAMGLVCFIGDGTCPARAFTHFRQHHRVAGPKEGVHIPFVCPEGLGPVEVELPASGRTVPGLGIHEKEAFAIAGSNAQGKTTLLQAILAGEDDHAPGDGRELLVSVRGARTAEAGGPDLHGADVSLFFRSLPPGMTGTPKAAFGRGSGSMTMAVQVQEAVRTGAPLLLIDEDRAAANLLVASCLQDVDVTPLAALLATQRNALGECALIFAASSLDPLIAQADRILLLSGHRAGAISPAAFRARYLRYLEGQMRQVEEK
ncbi:P-loop domain-containing protein, partial [uncultured Methanofollis sp.]|uniref:P-loop domain-containing protein n=1 Tax=uncultured Methanofollis sp. TaxID=262500 RepID=UPI002617F07D